MTVTTGRTLDESGEPVPGTGFEFDPDGWLAERIGERGGPITSHPTRPVWGVPLSTDDDTIRTLSIVGAGYDGPPEHYHEQSFERFDVREGEITLTLDGRDRQVVSGEEGTVETGVTHTFRNDADERAVVVTEIDSPGRLDAVLPTLGGLAHDPDRDPDDRLQQALIAERLAGNTTFTEAAALPSPLTGVAARVAELAGYQGAYAKYTQPVFWERHVEQPDLA